MMTYNETLEYLYNAAPAFEKVGAGAYKEGLSNTLALDQHFQHPHRKYKTIHVAGTNGKGSTSHMLAAILQKCGYRVGLFTSPHLVDFNERIRINGEPMPHQYLVDFVEQERAFFEPLQPSFFELTTALAFKYFAEQEVDIAVIEVGLGGRLDCTNIITPEVSVITNISFDHTGFLGDTLAKIAAEKAGIIKRGVPVVIGEYLEETRPVFEQKAREENAPVIFAQDEHYEHTPECQLKGYCQEKNVRTVLATVEVLRAKGIIGSDDSAVADGIAHVCDLTKIRGRWETLRQQPLVICDTGHNLGGWQILSRQIKEKYAEVKKQHEESTLRIVFGMVDDKDIDHVLQLLPRNATYYFTQADTHRAIPVEQLVSKARASGLATDGREDGTAIIKAYKNVSEAYKAALADSQPSDFVFVGGSNYVIADLLARSNE